MNFLFLSRYFSFSENRIIIGDLNGSQNTRSNFDVDRMGTGSLLTIVERQETHFLMRVS